MSGPLQNKISLGEDKALLSAKPFAEALSKSGLLPTARGNTFQDDGIEAALYNTNNQNFSAEMNRSRKAVVDLINRCYELVEEEYTELFGDDGLIVSNRGTFAYVMLIGSLNRHETDNGSLSKKSTVEERYKAIEKYLRALLRRLKRLNQKGRDDLFGRLGSGADTAWLRTYQTYVNEKYKSYEPEELIDWKERQDDSLQNEGRQLGNTIERYLKDTVISQLKILHGENWDIEIGAIQRSCELRAREETERHYKETGERNDIPWTEMFFINDYKKIIEDFWTARPDEDDEGEDAGHFRTFEEMFAIDIGYGFHSKKDKVKWMSVFNSYRNLWAHQGTKDKRLNREEVATLKAIHDHLIA